MTFSCLEDVLACRCESNSTAQPPLLDAFFRHSKCQGLGTSDRWPQNLGRILEPSLQHQRNLQHQLSHSGIPAGIISEDVSQARTKVRAKLSATHAIWKGWHAPSHSTCSTHQIFHHGYTVCLFLGVMRLISSCRNAFELRDCDTSDLVRCWRKVPITRRPGRNTSLLSHLHDTYLVNIALWKHAPISAPRMSSSSRGVSS